MISLQPEVLTKVSGFSFTDTIMSTIVNDIVIIGIVLLIYTGISLRPGRLQNMLESVIEYFYTLTEQIAGKRSEMIFPWFLSFFLFIVVSNFLSLLPGVGTIQFLSHGGGHHVPLFRGATSDLNVTLALATVSVGATHLMSLRHIGIKHYLARFFSLNPIFLFVGILELISEATKLVSLSFRLYGNMFAGEIVLSKVWSFLPFLMLESIAALVQALVFAMLTMVFMSMMTTVHSQGGEH